MTRIKRRSLLAAAGGAGLARHACAAEPAAPDAGIPFGLGSVTYNVPKDWDLAELLAILPKAGLRAIEFRTTHAHGVELSLRPTARAEVRRKVADAGIRQTSLGTTCEFHSDDPSVVRRNLDECIDWVRLAHDIGALGVKVRPNGAPAGVSLEKTLEQIGRALRECGRAAADHGVEIWVEVHGAKTQEPQNMRTIMEQCGHPSVGINWNSNPTDLKDASVRPAFELLSPFLKSVHINTLWSNYPYRELFGLLRRSNFSRYTLCEVGTPVRAEDGLLFFQCYAGLWRELCRP